MFTKETIVETYRKELAKEDSQYLGKNAFIRKYGANSKYIIEYKLGGYSNLVALAKGEEPTFKYSKEDILYGVVKISETLGHSPRAHELREVFGISFEASMMYHFGDYSEVLKAAGPCACRNKARAARQAVRAAPTLIQKNDPDYVEEVREWLVSLRDYLGRDLTLKDLKGGPDGISRSRFYYCGLTLAEINSTT